MLRYSGSETLHYLEKSAENIRIISLELTLATNKCEVCSLTKTHNLIFRRPDYEESCDRLFEKTGFDLIPQHEDYNRDN